MLHHLVLNYFWVNIYHISRLNWFQLVWFAQMLTYVMSSTYTSYTDGLVYMSLNGEGEGGLRCTFTCMTYTHENLNILKVKSGQRGWKMKRLRDMEEEKENEEDRGRRNKQSEVKKRPNRTHDK